MTLPLRALMVEDQENDAILVLRELRRGGYDVASQRVETADAMRTALVGQTWDVVISDFSLPTFNAPAALQVLKDSGLDLPFIIVSGTIGEETAISALKAGAHDFVLKGNPVRLVAAVARELREAEGRAARRRAEAALHESERRVELLLATAPMALFQEEAPRTTWVSDSIERVTGFPAAHFIEAGLWRSRLHPDDRDRVLGELSNVGEQGRLEVEYRFQCADGSYRWLLEQAVRDDATGGKTIIGSLLDITERKIAEEHLARANDELEARVAERTKELEEANEELRRARDAAEAASRAKSEFLANMSHELRTPLNSIIGFSELLEDSPIGTVERGYVGNVLSSGRHLLALINDILDLAKVEAGRLELWLTELDVGEALRNAEAVIRGLAERKRITLSTALADGSSEALPLLVADEARFTQILYNLLSNAVKFTPEGGTIVVRAGVTSLDPDDFDEDAVFVSVTDNGIGIAPKDQARIFASFEQVDSSYARRQQGTGLGLGLTRKLVELHEGRISVESELGKGSTFTFVLPLKQASGPRSIHRKSAPHDP